MDAVLAIAHFVVLVFFLTLIGRLILDWVQALSREFRPRGVVLVVAESVYTVTDPPLRALRKVLPPVRLGPVSLDLGFLVLFFLSYMLLTFTNPARY
ncbi:YggT family protein [Kineococcus xinjiangensis]|uniref:YggT family protein n=1 Tax=Kineococcus xinjiangensis TaxID=512762 RepID=A0A2S6IM13_9ACTN|nr:YggT family protein [Kineococcus xinjiangensis]PPK95228.1 YggT family protein [Kineococcus xinjiangensis]